MNDQTEYEKGFLDALERVIFMGDQLWDYHIKNANDESLCYADQEGALNCTIALGSFISHMKCLAAQVARKQVEMPIQVEERHWWSSPDGKGKN